VHQTHDDKFDNFVISWWIFKILSLLEREQTFQQNPYNTSHHTFSVLPHYLAKFRGSNFGKSDTVRLLDQTTPAFISQELWPPKVTEHSWPQPYQLQDMVHRLPASLSVAGAQHWWTEAAFSECLERHWPDHHLQCNWRVAWTSSRISAGKRRTLRATIVTIVARSAFVAERSSALQMYLIIIIIIIFSHDKRRFSFCQIRHDF